jgi:hypothetical protein
VRGRLLALAVATTIVAGVAVDISARQQQGNPADPAAAQAGDGDAVEAPATPRESAVFDLTGFWVSVVTEDWRWRMVTPPRGDFASIPLSEQGLRIAQNWDPAADEAAGLQCKAYGAAGLMRVPTRLRITWEDDSTLKVETDAGTQTRLFRFGDWEPEQAAGPSFQGDTKAEWERPRGRRGGGPAPSGGSLKTVTTNLLPGYLRKNGVSYSEDTTLTEHWDVLPQPNGDEWLVITTIVEDPQFLSRSYITTPNFRREPDGSRWDPSPCYAD